MRPLALVGRVSCNHIVAYAILGQLTQGGVMKETRKVHYVKGVFVCPTCRQSYVQEKWIEAWRVRCHKCDYRGALTDVSVEERMEEEIVRR
ncbi:MAG: hypothetical protein JW388_0335 [Nitrospira sp.]|nr:hypothetical protein [Nitrospira sp.]